MTGFLGVPTLHYPQGSLQHPELLERENRLRSLSSLCLKCVALSFLRCWLSVDSFVVDGQTLCPFFRLSRKYVLRYLDSLHVSPLPVSSACLTVTLLGHQSGQPAAPRYPQLPGGGLAGSLSWLQIGRLDLGQGCRGQSGSRPPFPTISQAACPLTEQRDPRKSQLWKEVTVVVFFLFWRCLLFPENNVWS